jgi:hypothetical protein
MLEKDKMSFTFHDALENGKSTLQLKLSSLKENAFVTYFYIER